MENNSSGQEVKPAFIHSRLDEASLSPVQFRIYCHIARRGECYASAGSIARVCRIKRNSVWPAVSILERRGMIEIIHRPGRTTVYQTSPLATWIDDLTQKGSQVNPTQKGSRHVTRKGSHRWSERGATHPTRKGSHKVTPSEVSPPQGNPPKGESPRVFSEAEKIRMEGERKRIELRLGAIYDGASEDALGPMYGPSEREERKNLKARLKEINASLGQII